MTLETALAAAPASASADPNIPPGIRNNNWGNVAPLANGQPWPGQIGVDKNGVVRFATPQDGVRATLASLRAYGQVHRLNTVRSLVAHWAPASAASDKDAYARTVADGLGVRPTSTINMAGPGVLNGLAHGVFAAESGARALHRALSAGAIRFDPQNPDGHHRRLRPGARYVGPDGKVRVK